MPISTTVKCLYDGVLGASLADMYTAPSGTRAVMKAISITNTTGGVVSLTLKLNPRTGGTDRTVYDDQDLGDEQTFTAPALINMVLEPGGKLRGSGNGLEVVISGAEYVGS